MSPKACPTSLCDLDTEDGLQNSCSRRPLDTNATALTDTSMANTKITHSNDLTVDDLPGMDWANDALFFTHKWRDETSMYDDHPSVHWSPGGEYYSREFKVRMPIAFKNCDELSDHFIEWMDDHYPACNGFWLD